MLYQARRRTSACASHWSTRQGHRIFWCINLWRLMTLRSCSTCKFVGFIATWTWTEPAMTSFYTQVNVCIDICVRWTVINVGLSFFAAIHLRAWAQVAYAHINLFPMSFFILSHHWSVSFTCLLRWQFHANGQYIPDIVCVISLRYSEKREVYPITMHFAKSAAANALIDGYKSIELCQAYILLSIYAVPTCRWEEDCSWLYTGLAIW
jgi:hypothetical protein